MSVVPWRGGVEVSWHSSATWLGYLHNMDICAPSSSSQLLKLTNWNHCGFYSKVCGHSGNLQTENGGWRDGSVSSMNVVQQFWLFCIQFGLGFCCRIFQMKTPLVMLAAYFESELIGHLLVHIFVYTYLFEGRRWRPEHPYLGILRQLPRIGCRWNRCHRWVCWSQAQRRRLPDQILGFRRFHHQESLRW